MLMRSFMLAAIAAFGFGWVDASLASLGPANALAIAQAAGADSPATEAGCRIRRWCGPEKCHRRLWCR
jgi:hypothetical protein